MGEVNGWVTHTALAIRDEDELEVAASVLDAALRRAKVEGQLVWSSEIPKVPGWYWRRYTYEQTYMEVVHVDVSGAGIVAHSNGNGSWIQTLQREGVEWAGPIALPLDAHAAQIEEGK